MTDEEVNRLARAATSHVAQAMIASYEGETERYREVINCILASGPLTILALQAAIQCPVEGGANPYHVRDANVVVRITGDPE